MEKKQQKAFDVMDANAMEFIHLKIHPCFVIDLHLTFSLV
jgi:hypothetical protein